jgi:CheY-like chemotaxis protein
MSGLEAIALIRNLERAGKLRRSHVIALTGNARQQQIEDALAAGMDSGETDEPCSVRHKELTLRCQ